MFVIKFYEQNQSNQHQKKHMSDALFFNNFTLYFIDN